LFDNSYFTNLMGLEWQPRVWDGPLQYENPAKTLMMLPTDLALKTDPAFSKYCAAFAKDEDAFRASFKPAYEKLISLGCPAHAVGGGVAPSAPGGRDADSRSVLEHCMHGSIEHAQAAVAKGGDPKWLEPNSARTTLHKAAFWGHGATPRGGAQRNRRNQSNTHTHARTRTHAHTHTHRHTTSYAGWLWRGTHSLRRAPTAIYIHMYIYIYIYIYAYIYAVLTLAALPAAHIVPWLLEKPPAGCGLDANAQDYAGDTALHDAARFGHTDVVKQLLANGAKPGVKNKAGQTAAAVAIENGKDLSALGLSEGCAIF